MPTKYHFISGLPRSGSTLLTAILRQNPRFSVALASPVVSLIEAIQPYTSGGEYSLFFDDATRADMFQGLFDSFYKQTVAKMPENPVIFDSNRMWTGFIPLIAHLHPDARIICCVRDIGWILDSFERLLAKNPLQMTRIFGAGPRNSILARAENLMNPEYGLVGLPYYKLSEAWFGEQAKRLIVVPYNSLVKDPKRVLGRIYQELGETPFDHDFQNVEFDDVSEYDAYVGLPGLHTVRKKIEHIERAPILPPDIFFKYATAQFWDKPELNPRRVTIL
ncbi:MAG: sulfotransferase [Burkholderiaceae bacterium]|nr:sulfotransferase [Burkholderiaceae bacterium]